MHLFEVIGMRAKPWPRFNDKLSLLAYGLRVFHFDQMADFAKVPIPLLQNVAPFSRWQTQRVTAPAGFRLWSRANSASKNAIRWSTCIFRSHFHSNISLILFACSGVSRFASESIFGLTTSAMVEVEVYSSATPSRPRIVCVRKQSGGSVHCCLRDR